jgi:hypothetical protein
MSLEPKTTPSTQFSQEEVTFELEFIGTITYSYGKIYFAFLEKQYLRDSYFQLD